MMSSVEAIALARKIQTLSNEYQIAQVLINLEAEAEKSSVREMAATLRKVKEGTYQE